MSVVHSHGLGGRLGVHAMNLNLARDIVTEIQDLLRFSSGIPAADPVADRHTSAKLQQLSLAQESSSTIQVNLALDARVILACSGPSSTFQWLRWVL